MKLLTHNLIPVYFIYAQFLLDAKWVSIVKHSYRKYKQLDRPVLASASKIQFRHSRRTYSENDEKNLFVENSLMNYFVFIKE